MPSSLYQQRRRIKKEKRHDYRQLIINENLRMMAFIEEYRKQNGKDGLNVKVDTKRMDLYYQEYYTMLSAIVIKINNGKSLFDKT
jgi:hypothetical protein